MNKKKKIRLMVKYRVRSCGSGMFAEGFLAGLESLETRAERKQIREKDVEPPTTDFKKKS